MINLASIVLSMMILSVESVSSTITNTDFPEPAQPVSYQFDLGAVGESGYTSVGALRQYSTDIGYGFSGKGVGNVPASGKGALSDAVEFTDDSSSFCVDLEEGLYKIDVTLGDTDRTSVYMEDMLQIVNMTKDNARDFVIIPVTDGQLNIRGAAGKDDCSYSISEINITKLSGSTDTPHTVWLCGDSTVCNYYPRETNVQAGWGQVLDEYIDTSVWQIRNMATSGQWAKGFLEAGQFDAIEYYGKPGDIFIVSIGINDVNHSNEEDYYSSVTDMVKRAKAKGMTVYLVKQQGRVFDITEHPNLRKRWFGEILDRIGSEQNVNVIDLYNLFNDYCRTIGQEAVYSLYMEDDSLHPNRKGSMTLAEIVSKQIDWDVDPSEKNFSD